MRVPCSLAALTFMLAVAGCAQPPDAKAQSTEVGQALGQPGPDSHPGNLPPSTSLQVTPIAGRAPLPVVVSLGGRDPDGDALSWTLDLGDGSPLQRGTTLPVALEQVFGAGRFRVTFIVTDGKETATARVTVEAAASAAASSSDQPDPPAPPQPQPPPPSPSTTSSTSGTSTSASPSMTSSSTTTSQHKGPKHTSTSTSTSATSTTSTTSTSTTSTTSSTTTTTSATTSTTDTSTSSETTTTSEPPPPPNTAPDADLSAQPDATSAPTNVTYTVTASDADGDELWWSLDVQGDGTPDADGTGTGPWTVAASYDQPGTYTAILRVTDGTDTVTRTVDVTIG